MALLILSEKPYICYFIKSNKKVFKNVKQKPGDCHEISQYYVINIHNTVRVKQSVAILFVTVKNKKCLSPAERCADIITRVHANTWTHSYTNTQSLWNRQMFLKPESWSFCSVFLNDCRLPVDFTMGTVRFRIRRDGNDSDWVTRTHARAYTHNVNVAEYVGSKHEKWHSSWNQHCHQDFLLSWFSHAWNIFKLTSCDQQFICYIYPHTYLLIKYFWSCEFCDSKPFHHVCILLNIFKCVCLFFTLNVLCIGIIFLILCLVSSLQYLPIILLIPLNALLSIQSFYTWPCDATARMKLWFRPFFAGTNTEATRTPTSQEIQPGND